MTFSRGSFLNPNAAKPDISAWIRDLMQIEDCIRINPQRVAAERIGADTRTATDWGVVERLNTGQLHYLHNFKVRGNAGMRYADILASIIKNQGINQACYFDRPSPSLHYFKNGNTLSTESRFESCRPLLGRLRLREIASGWQVLDANNELVTWANDPSGPTNDSDRKRSHLASFNRATLQINILNRYRPNKICSLGREGTGAVIRYVTR